MSDVAEYYLLYKYHPQFSGMDDIEGIRSDNYNLQRHEWIPLLYRGGYSLNDFQRFNRLTSKKKLFRNVVQYRIKQVNKFLGICVGIILPVKQDLEISSGIIGGGLTIFHGHGTVIVCKEAGENLTVYQGATIGKNSKIGQTNSMPTIGNNVTVYTNAVVAGDIVIGDNVDIGAGSVVMKDVPSNTVVIGNPCVFKRKRMD